MSETMATEIVQETTVGAPRERVFRALTDARELERWFPSRAESDPRPGGGFHYSWEFPDAPEKDHVQKGAYASVEPGRRVAYPWSVGGTPTDVDFTLENDGDGTRVRMVHGGWTPDIEGAREQHVQGWQMFLSNLKTVLEGGSDVRASGAGMRVR